MYNMVVLTLNSYLLWANPEKLLFLCMFALLIMYTWYVFTVMTQIKNHLGIHALHLGKDTKEEYVCLLQIHFYPFIPIHCFPHCSFLSLISMKRDKEEILLDQDVYNSLRGDVECGYLIGNVHLDIEVISYRF